MGKSKGKHRLDKFYHLAKEQGYRSRAAFKLVQLNRKYDFLSGSRTLLDLCAAPGGWLQVAAKTMPVGSLIVGVDLDPIRPIPGVHTLVGDITSQKTRQDLKKALGGAAADAVIHDGAPNVGGAWSSEAYTQSALVLDALRLATEFLAPKGAFVTKIFRSQDYNSLLYAFKQLFEKVDATKPAASRNTSAEIFVVCQGYKAPTKIDPRLLDSKHLFKEVVEQPKKMGPDALLKDKFKATRQRGGYEDGLSLTRRVAPAAAFVLSEAPVEMLGRCSSFALEGPESEAAPTDDGDDDMVGALGFAALAALVRGSAATTAEVRAACADLQVLGRSEFKALLKWRMQLKRELKAPAAEKPQAPELEAVEPPDSEEEAEAREAAVLEEMQGVKEAAEHRLKKERKKRREARIKARIRAAQMAQSKGVNQDADAPGEALFSLATVRGRGSAAVLADAAAPSEAELNEMEVEANAARELVVPEALGSSASDSEEDRRYDEVTEAALEDAYSQYLNRQGQRDAAARRRARLQTKRKPGDPGAVDESGEDASDGEALPAPRFDQPSSDSEEEGDGLLVRLDEAAAGRASTDAAIAAQWFSQDVFAAAPTLDVVAAAAPAAGAKSGAVGSKAGQKAAAAAKQAADSGAEAPGTPPPGAAGEPPLRKAKQGVAAAAAGAAKPMARAQLVAAAAPPSAMAIAKAKDAAADGFEVVTRGTRSGLPSAAAESSHDSGDSSSDGEDRVANKARPLAEPSSSDDDEGFMDSLDLQGKAEVRALAQRMLRKRSRDELLEGAYNKYAFHDEGLPRWFVEDQHRHARAPAVLTKEEIEVQKAQLRAVDARPIKKVLEAKARKKKRLAASLDKARAKSEAVVGQEDVPMRSKMKEVEKIYAKARAAAGQGSKSDKKKKAGTGRRREQKSKGRPLDRRMLSDKRQRDMKAKKAVAKKAKKGRKGKGPKPAGKGGRR